MAELKTKPAQLPDFQVVNGISEAHKLAIIAFTKEDGLIKKNTSDLTRFSSLAELNNWLSTRSTYTLVGAEGKLLGLVWLGPKVLETQLQDGLNCDDYDYTIAIRTYGEARGKGLAINFMRESLQRFLDDSKSHPRGIWAEISNDNVASQRTVASLGFKIATQPNEKGKIIMVGKVSNLLLS